MYTVVSRLAEASTVQLLRRTLEMGATASKAHTRVGGRAGGQGGVLTGLRLPLRLLGHGMHEAC